MQKSGRPEHRQIGRENIRLSGDIQREEIEIHVSIASLKALQARATLVRMVGSLVLLLLSVAVGFGIAMYANANALGAQSWKETFTAAAMLCLGFGAATFLHWMTRHNQDAVLQSNFERLSARADALAADLQSAKRPQSR